MCMLSKDIFQSINCFNGKVGVHSGKTGGCTSLMKIKVNITCNKTYYDDMHSWICPSCKNALEKYTLPL